MDLTQHEKILRDRIKTDLEMGYLLIAGSTSSVVWTKVEGFKDEKRFEGRCPLAMAFDPCSLDEMAGRCNSAFDWNRSEMIAFIKGWDGEKSCDPNHYHWKLGSKLRKEYKPKDT